MIQVKSILKKKGFFLPRITSEKKKAKEKKEAYPTTFYMQREYQLPLYTT